MNLADFFRKDFYQKYAIERIEGGKIRATISTRSTVENISGRTVPYQAWIQIMPDGNPRLIDMRVTAGSKVFGGQSEFTESPTRKRILEAKSEEIELQAGAQVVSELRYSIEGDEDGSDIISFGIPTGGATVEVDAPDDFEVAVDPIQPATSREGNVWVFDRRFEQEQHIPVRWWNKSS